MNVRVFFSLHLLLPVTHPASRTNRDRCKIRQIERYGLQVKFITGASWHGLEPPCYSPPLYQNKEERTANFKPQNRPNCFVAFALAPSPSVGNEKISTASNCYIMDI